MIFFYKDRVGKRPQSRSSKKKKEQTSCAGVLFEKEGGREKNHFLLTSFRYSLSEFRSPLFEIQRNHCFVRLLNMC